MQRRLIPILATCLAIALARAGAARVTETASAQSWPSRLVLFEIYSST